MAVYKRNGHWHFTKTINGVRYRCALPTARTKAQAEDAEREKLNEIHEGIFGKPKGTACFVEYAEKDYLQWARENKRSNSDQYFLKPIREFFKRKTFAEISPLLIEKYKSERRRGLTKKGEQRKPASVNRELACLSRIFSMAVRDGIAASNPCLEVTKLREENRRDRYLSTDEERRLLAVCAGERAHLRPIIIMAIYTGMRRGEILSLRWSQVDFSRGIIHLVKTKSGKGRDVPINQLVRDELLCLPKSGEFVFTSSRTGCALVEIKRAFRASCLIAGIEGLHFHDLRHTAATRWAEAGAQPSTIAELLGHADLRMTARYTHATDYAKRRVVEEAARMKDSEDSGHNLVTMKKREA
jgi:integrase